MLATLVRITPFTMLLLSVALLMLGIGLQNTLLGVRAGLESFSSIEVGSLMGFYFFGFPGCVGLLNAYERSLKHRPELHGKVRPL